MAPLSCSSRAFPCSCSRARTSAAWLPFDNMWTRGGNLALPILGDAGSIREWVLMTPISLYAVVGFGWALLSQMGFDVDSRWDVLVTHLATML